MCRSECETIVRRNPGGSGNCTEVVPVFEHFPDEAAIIMAALDNLSLDDLVNIYFITMIILSIQNFEIYEVQDILALLFESF